MIDRIKETAKVLLGRGKAGRNLTVFPDDIFIVSYPKSGNTWTRFLVGNLVYPKDVIDFSNIELKVPDIYQNINDILLRIPRPRILKSHEYFDPRYKKVIYIVRDPRDVAVSYYYYHIKVRRIDDKYPIDRFIQRFIRGELDSFGSWEENVGSWMGVRQYDENFLLLQYEDLLTNTLDNLKKIAVFLEIEVSEGLLANVIELSSFDRMKKLERDQSNTWKVLAKSRKDISFVRKGVNGNWQEELPDRGAQMIECEWEDLMQRLGYLL